LCTKNYNYILINIYCSFWFFYLVSHLLSNCPLAVVKMRYVCTYFCYSWPLAKWPAHSQHNRCCNDRQSANRVLIIFGRPPWWGRVIISAAFFRLFVHLLPSIYIVVYFISIRCSWLLVLTGELAVFMLFPPSFMCNFLLPHHSMPSRISLYPDRFCPNFQLPYALFLLLLACLGWLLFWWWAESI